MDQKTLSGLKTGTNFMINTRKPGIWNKKKSHPEHRMAPCGVLQIETDWPLRGYRNRK